MRQQSSYPQAISDGDDGERAERPQRRLGRPPPTRAGLPHKVDPPEELSVVAATATEPLSMVESM
jgi:hypothetical protein